MSITPTHCQWCQRDHDGLRCPLVKAYEYYEDGSVKRVEFLTPGDYLAPIHQWLPSQLPRTEQPWRSTTWPSNPNLPMPWNPLYGPSRSWGEGK